MPRVPIEPIPTPEADSTRLAPPPWQCQCAPLISVGKSQKPPPTPPTFTSKTPTPGYGHCVSALAGGARNVEAQKPNASAVETQTAACISSPSFLNGPTNDLLVR